MIPLAVFELLESRRLLSAAVVVGTDADDYISVSQLDGNIVVTDMNTGETFSVASGDVLSVSISGLGGNDTLQVLDDTGTFFAPIHSDGGAGDDWVEGASGDDVLDGGEGNNFVFAYGGNDVVHGGEGADFLAGMGGNDSLHG